MPEPHLDLRRLMADVAAAIAAHASELDDLDRALGDGDHGTTVSRGFARATEAVTRDASPAPDHLLTVAGRALLTMGGASGPLFSTIFLEAARAIGPDSALTGRAAAAMLDAASEGVRVRGSVRRGDKTLYDALAPAAEAARLAAEAGLDAHAVIAAAAAAAKAGAADTRSMVARRGRAGFLGERSAGHPDPGATTVAIALDAVAQRCRKYGEFAGAR